MIFWIFCGGGHSGGFGSAGGGSEYDDEDYEEDEYYEEDEAQELGDDDEEENAVVVARGFRRPVGATVGSRGSSSGSSLLSVKEETDAFDDPGRPNSAQRYSE